jgi:predicted transcriptional regulator
MSLNKGPKYPTIVSKEVDCTYSHAVKLLTTFETFGLIKSVKRGRIKVIELTDRGKEVARSLENILVRLSKLERSSSGVEK